MAMIEAGKLKTPIKFQRNDSNTKNEYGESVPNWVDAGKAWAQVTQTGATESAAAQGMKSRAKYAIRMRYQPGINSGMRVILPGGTVLEIEGVVNPNHSTTELNLTCHQHEGA